MIVIGILDDKYRYIVIRILEDRFAVLIWKSIEENDILHVLRVFFFKDKTIETLENK